MIIKFKNLGPIESGEIDFNNLKGINLIIGKNNTGKTYLSNFIYAVLRNISLKRVLGKDELEKKIEIIKKIEENDFENFLLETELPFIFHTNKNYFKNTKIDIANIDKKYPVHNIRFFPAERSGAVLFYNQLLENRNDVLRGFELSQDINLLNKISRYSEPVNDYIKFLNRLEEYQNKDETEIYKDLIKNINIQNIIEGEVIIKSNQIIYKNEDDTELNMGLVSSTVKTLAGFFLYLKYQAQKRDIIFIDEIELNLHPENQRKIMRLINYLSKQGLKFVISTHSPVITQEMNNMIMFEKCKDKIDDKIIKEHSIDKENYGLKQEDINVYFLNNKKIEMAEVREDGIITETFNETIGEIDNLYQDLIFAMEEE